MRDTFWSVSGRVLAIAALAVAPVVLGCGGEDDDTDPTGSAGTGADVAGGGSDTGGADESGTFTEIYNDPYFAACQGCHGPSAAGFVAGTTEATQDWAGGEDAAHAALLGAVSGLEDTNFEACNGVPFIGANPELSMLAAALDENIRANFAHPDFPDCTGDDISDMTAKAGAIPADTLQLLKDWITAGAPR